MKSTTNFRNSGKDLYSDESKKSKKPNFGQDKPKNSKKRFIMDLDDDDDDLLNLDYKKRESIEDYLDDDDEDD